MLARSNYYPVEHQLSSGIRVQQDVFLATRFVQFSTEYDDWPVATHGGTAFIVEYKSRWFAVLARHVFGKRNAERFYFKDLLMFTKNSGESCIPLKVVRGVGVQPLPGRTKEDLGNIGDMAVVEVETRPDEITDRYIMDANTICDTKPGNSLKIFGFLKSGSQIEVDGDDVTTFSQPCRLGLECVPTSSSAEELYSAKGDYNPSSPPDLAGISGGPVYNVSQSALCGIVLRAGINLSTKQVTAHFIGVDHVTHLLDAIISEKNVAKYWSKSIAESR